MKHLKRFALLAGTVCVCLMFSMFIINRDSETDLKGTSSKALRSYYDAVKAREINENNITLLLDGQMAPVSGDRLLMSDHLVLMIPAIDVNDLFDCSVSWLGDGRIKISGKEDGALLDPNQMAQDGVCMYDDQGEMMVSVSWLSDFFDYDFTWSEDTYTVSLTTPKKMQLPLPEVFDLREEGKVSPVRNQGSRGTCWAFSALSSMESVLLPDQEWQFSADHLVHQNGFDIDEDAGGDYNIALSYLASWVGPVEETADPYDDGASPDELRSVVHLQDAVILRERDHEQIKRLIYEYGAVQSAIYSRPDAQEIRKYYNSDTASYYYPLRQECNHDITIIGWDDAFPKENFNGQPEHDGAYICKNSWGASFGKDGYFYISYDDPNIGIYGIAYTGIESADNYDDILQSDLLGWTGSIGYNDPEAWFANIFSSDQAGDVGAVSFYATDPDTWYDIWFTDDFTAQESLSDRRCIQSGYLPEKGYFTIPIDQMPEVKPGKRFAVIVHIYTKDSVHPVAIEYPANELTRGVDLTDGESYMSFNGEIWSRMETEAQCNVCLKAFMNYKD